ncbi:MAG: sulfotransferase [Nitrospirae bacterium]|nr:sulfotransferase [Nitrospirota bacterium]
MRENKMSPLIIIGMHRSGTAMIAQLLERLGLFTGCRKQHNHEALFFLNINEWLLRQSCAAWDCPKPFSLLLGNREIRSLAVDHIRYISETPAAVSFLGWRKYLRCRSLFNLDVPWGWKDPRNTYTLPIWLEVFPGARVIHICRNGVDVANSLVARQRKGFEYKKSRYRAMKALYWLRPKRGGFTDSIRCASLEGAFSLWEEYVMEAKKHVGALGSRAIELKYEDFVSSPYESLRELAGFCELEAGDEEVRRVSGLVRRDRAYAYRSEAGLRAFAHDVAERLAVYGY